MIVQMTADRVAQHGQRVLDKLAAVPHPPRTDIDQLRTIAQDSRTAIYVDTGRDALIYFHIGNGWVSIPWWLPMHITPARQLDILPVLVRGTSDLLAASPEMATWALFGDLQGMDRAQGQAIAASLRSRLRFPIGGPQIVTVYDSMASYPFPDFPAFNDQHYARAQSTVGEINRVGTQILNSLRIVF